MFLPIVPLHAVTVFGLKESDLGDRFTAVARRESVGVFDDPEPQRNYFIRSDQYSFIRHGVPGMYFEVGAGDDTAAAGILQRWNRRRYHRPSDDLDQPIDFAAAVGFNRLLYDFTRDLANADTRPAWKPDSFFRRFVPAATASAPPTGRSHRGTTHASGAR